MRRAGLFRPVLPLLGLLLATGPLSLAEEADDPGLDEDVFVEDVLSPGEIAERELQRRRAAPPVLSCAPARLRASLTKGTEGESKTVELTIANAGGQVLEWSITQTPEWARPSERAGSLGFEQSRTVEVTLDSSALEPGVERAGVVIEAAGAEGSPLVLPVFVTVKAKRGPGPPRRPSAGRQPARARPTEGRAAEAGPKRRSARDVAARREPRGGPGGGGRGRRGVIGCHAGVLLAGAGRKADYGLGYAADLFWRSRDGAGGSRLAYEIALGVGGGESASAPETSTMASGSAAAVLYLLRGEKSRVYALAGMSVVQEQVTDEETGAAANTGSLVDIGLGAAFGGRDRLRFDARLRYSFLIGSENVPGVLGVLAGVVF